MRDAFVGIDVAFAKDKRLPIMVCTKEDQETVTGHDENDGSLSDGKYKYSVRFVAAIVK